MGSHVALEAQRDMAGSLCDMARSFWGFWNLGTRATSRWRPNATLRAPNATSRARFTLFWGGSAPLGSCHVVLEAQRVMAGSLCDMAHSFTLFLGGFGPLGSSHVVLEAQHDMAGSLCDVAHSFCSLFGGFGPLDLEPRRVGGPTRHGGLPIRRGALVLLSFGGIRTLGSRATSCWRPNATWRAPYATWRARFALFRGDSDAWISSHVALEAQHDMAGSQYDVAGRNTMRRAFF